jgi:transposase
MIADLTHLQVWVATTPVDMRKSFDALAEVVRSFLGHDPQSGHLFVFRNRTRHLVKVLWWDHEGLAIYYKKQEPESTQMFGFTEVGRLTHNWRVGLVEDGRMV